MLVYPSPKAVTLNVLQVMGKMVNKKDEVVMVLLGSEDAKLKNCVKEQERKMVLEVRRVAEMVKAILKVIAPIPLNRLLTFLVSRSVCLLPDVLLMMDGVPFYMISILLDLV